MAYIIFNTAQEAEARSEQAGIAKGLSYHKTGKGSRYWWGWSVEASEEPPEDPEAPVVAPRAYIEIVKNVSVDPETEEETITIPDQNLLTDDDVLVDELPEDWVQPSGNPDGND
jgi:hypothetical protein